MTRRSLGRVALLALVGTGCASATVAEPVATTTTSTTEITSTTQVTSTTSDAELDFPDVVDAEAEQDADGTWRFAVTLSSPYDTPEQYADAWRVVGPDGTEYGIRVLLHDHANEQPFTRSQAGIEIPDDVEVVTIEGRDLRNGWGGATLELRLGRGGS